MLDLRFREPLAVPAYDSSKTVQYVVYCGEPFERHLYVTVAIDHDRQVRYSRQDLRVLSSKFKYHHDKWIPEADVYYILNKINMDVVAKDLLDGTRVALVQHEKRLEFAKESGIPAHAPWGCYLR